LSIAPNHEQVEGAWQLQQILGDADATSEFPEPIERPHYSMELAFAIAFSACTPRQPALRVCGESNIKLPKQGYPFSVLFRPN
jgi:hypothetical protein